jgi:hydroxypyruvate reductase
VNEPTAEGVTGAEEILRIVGSLGPADLCIALISGGGSALLPAPIEGISLADKLAVTQFLSAAGADIAELNTVRKQLSRIKGGGLARACRAGRLVVLIISDISGDPLDLIASGPTVPDKSAPQDALTVLEKFSARQGGVPGAVFDVLNRKAGGERDKPIPTCRVKNFIIGNNATAVDAAGQEAERLGYIQALTCANKPEGQVEPIGRHLAEMAVHMRSTPGPNCLISGGEGTVKLASEAERGLGGRNQQTVLAALMRLQEIGGADAGAAAAEIVILSAATDGEDGPTDAAGAFVDAQIMEEVQRRGLDAADFLRRNDAYHFFDPLGALVKTGPTNTNVCDVRVVLVETRPLNPTTTGRA